MGYREVRRMELQEVVRRWQAGESQRAIARALGLARMTVEKYVRAAVAAGLCVHGPPPSEALLVTLGRANRPGRAPGGPAPQQGRLAPYQEQIARWLTEERLQLTRVQELLARQGVAVTYTTLRRFRDAAGFGRRARTTVRMPEWPPGEVAELDFGRLGVLADPTSGKRQTIWALVVVLCCSRHSFVWPLVQQTLVATIEGLEATWRFFGGVPKRLILDNFPAAVAGTDPLAPQPTVGFLEYSQARGFLVDPARVRHPQDKPRVERGVAYVQQRFWKGGTFADLADARRQAEHWCRDVAGQRVHGTTRRLPLVVFTDEEQGQLTPLAQTPYGHQHPDHPDAPYDVPIWRSVTVQADQHLSFQYALYSVPASTCPPGTTVEVRGDRDLVTVYHHGALVKVHPRQSAGGRHTDPDDYPPERATYALRAPDRLIAQATALGAHVGTFATRLLAGSAPWAKLRQGQKLLRLGERYTASRLDAACARALGFDLLDVRRVERILVLALDHEARNTLPPLPPGERLRVLPVGRFTRPGAAFARTTVAVTTAPQAPHDSPRGTGTGTGAGADAGADAGHTHSTTEAQP